MTKPVVPILLLAMAQCGPAGPILSCPPTMSADRSTPFSLSFATDTSTMGAECACNDVPAGTNGEIVSDVRDSGAFCTKNNWLTNIATGDMVWCGGDKLRVMGGDDGGLGFLSELAGHNFNASQDFSAAPWTTVAVGGGAAPTVSPPDAGLCPDGTTTATRVQIPSVTGPSKLSAVYNLSGCQSGAGFANTVSAYFKGYSGDGGVDLTGGGSGTYQRFGYTPNAWTRGVLTFIQDSSAVMEFGNYGTYYSNPVTEPAADFFVCFAQCEASDHATSYTPGLRGGDRITAPASIPMSADLLMSVDVLTEGVGTAGVVANAAVSSTSYFSGNRGSSSAPNMSCTRVFSSLSDSVTITDAGFLAGAHNNLTCSWSGDDANILRGCLGGVCGDAGTVNVPAATIFGNATELDFGGRLDAVEFKSQPDGIIRNLQLSSSAKKEIYLFGDSIVAQPPMGGGSDSIARIEIHRQKGNLVSISNLGVSGDKINDCEIRWSAVTAQLRAHPPSASRTYMMIQCGTNSTDSVDSGYIIDRLEFMLADAKDAGAHPLWSTITPSDSHCATQQVINNALTTWCAENGVPMANTRTVLLQDPNDQCSGIKTGYERDSVHFNDAGTVAMTNVWIQAGRW